MIEELVKVLSNGYKVITGTKKNAFGNENLTEIITSVFNPEGQLVIARNKGIFRNWSSDCSLMNLPKDLKGSHISKHTQIKTPQILPNFSNNRDEFIQINENIFRPTGGEGMYFIERTHFGNYGGTTAGRTQYHEPFLTQINPEKHEKAMELFHHVFG